MANEVEIRITATDLTGPAFAGVMSRLAALKAAADAAAADRQMNFSLGDAMAKVAALQAAMDGLKIGGINMSDLNTSLLSLRSKMQSLGIADIADIDVQPGRLMTQMQLIKRLIEQAGISDVMDFNLTPADLTAQLSKLGAISYTLPIKFDFSKVPLGQIGTEHVPVVFDIANMPKMGPTMPILNLPANIIIKDFVQQGQTMPVIDIPAKIDLQNIPIAGEIVKLETASNQASGAVNKLSGSTGNLGNMLTAADMAITPFLGRILQIGQNSDGASKYMSGLGMGLAELIPWVDKIGEILAYTTVPNIAEFGDLAARSGAILLNNVSIGASKASDKIAAFSTALDSGIPLWKSGGGVLGGLTGHLQLFGGWLTKLGAPAWVGTVTGMHILVEGLVELSAVLIPATIAFGAFVGAAIPTVTDMYAAEKNMYTVSQALGIQMPGLSGGFKQIADAVQPNVYILAGEGLAIINSKTGEFQRLATGAGGVVDNLGARIEMALGGNGLDGFISHGVDDLQTLGNIFGNVFGIIGNLLKTVPGYAELLFRGIMDVTGALENITGSGAVQGIIGIALALHGAIFYAGLAVTGILALQGPLLSVAAWAMDGVATLGALGSMFLEAAADEGIMAAAMDMISLVDPWILAAAAVGILVGGLVALVSWLGGSVNAQRAYLNEVEDTIQQQKTFAGIISVTSDALKTTNDQLKTTPQYTQQMVTGFHGMSHEAEGVNSTYTNLTNNSKALTAQLAMEQNRQKQLVGIFGSVAAAQTAMGQAGIPLSAIADANASSWKKDIVELSALNTATVQLAGYQNGQAAAMQNALNVMQGTTTQIANITQAQDGLMNLVTGSENAFDTFALGQATLAGNFGLTAKQAQTVSHSLGDIKLSATTAGATMGGLNQASLTLSQSFYTQVSNAQKVIDSLEQAQMPANQMTAAVGALAGQMLPFAQNDEAARATMVAMINDALGPGTVSMQNLNTWVKQNATTMDGLNTIVEQATVKVGTLANVLETQLNAQFQAALLKSSGATGAVQAFADAITNTGSSSIQTTNARVALINDLIKTGMSSQQAQTYVQNLQNQIDSMHGASVTVNAATGQAVANVQSFQSMVDSLHGMTVQIGTQIVGPTQLTQAFLNGIGYASGGIVGHAASGGMRNGLTVVGEMGPELVRLPQGSQVYPTGVTPGYANQGGGGGWGGDVNVVFQSQGQGSFDRFMLEWVRNTVRVKGGGDVQKAFGKKM